MSKSQHKALLLTGRRTSRAPFSAASSIALRAWAMFLSLSAVTDNWQRAILNWNRKNRRLHMKMKIQRNAPESKIPQKKSIYKEKSRFQRDRRDCLGYGRGRQRKGGRKPGFFGLVGCRCHYSCRDGSLEEIRVFTYQLREIRVSAREEKRVARVWASSDEMIGRNGGGEDESDSSGSHRPNSRSEMK